MSDKAIVKKILSENTALVIKLPEEKPHKECIGCGSCGTSTEHIETIVQNSFDIKPGDTVYIESDEKQSVKLLVILVAGPILAPLSLYMIGSALGLPAIISGIMAGAGLFLAYRLIKFHNNKVASEPPITKIVRVQERSGMLKNENVIDGSTGYILTEDEKHVQRAEG